MEITSSVVLPVTQAQLNEFSGWVRTTYETYDQYMAAIKSPEVDNYIKTNILPEEMNYALRISERYIGEKWGDANIQYMLLNRRRVTAKMKNLKDKIAKQTFPRESAHTRRVKSAEALARRQAREAETIAWERAREAQEIVTRIIYQQLDRVDDERIQNRQPVQKIFIEEDIDMNDECSICMCQHKLSEACLTGCGHHFGTKCLSRWTENTCPLCRTKIENVVEFEMKTVEVFVIE